jgi:hypothetical protein
MLKVKISLDPEKAYPGRELRFSASQLETLGSLVGTDVTTSTTIRAQLGVAHPERGWDRTCLSKAVVALRGALGEDDTWFVCSSHQGYWWSDNPKVILQHKALWLSEAATRVLTGHTAHEAANRAADVQLAELTRQVVTSEITYDHFVRVAKNVLKLAA